MRAILLKRMRGDVLFMTIPKGVSICDKVPSQQGKTISVGPSHQSCFYLEALGTAGVITTLEGL